MNNRAASNETKHLDLRLRITRYGYLGLAPFFSIAGLVWVLPDDFGTQLSLLFLSYSAVIASFLAGMLWGTQIIKPISGDERSYSLIDVGIATSLLPWLSLLAAATIDAPGVLVVCLITSALCFYAIRQTEIKHLEKDYELWFEDLRVLLTKTVLACHFSVVIFNLVY